MCDYKLLSSKWKETVNDGLTNSEWDSYDKTIVDIVTAHNMSLKINLDWKTVKAMLWTESGGPAGKDWNRRVLQIGNAGDPGWSVVMAAVNKNSQKSEGAELILSDSDRILFKSTSIDTPGTNINAALVYLLTRLAITGYVLEYNREDTKEHEYTVGKGDNYYDLQKKLGTTVAVLEELNGKSSLRLGQKLKYRKAQMVRKITSWRSFDHSTIQTRYNGNGDTFYACKLDYVKELLAKLQRKA